MEHVFPSEMFSYFATNADHLVGRLSDGVGRLLWLAGNSVSQLAQGNSCVCRTATQVWFGIAVASVLTDSPFGAGESPLRLSPTKPRFGKIAHVV